MTLTPSDLTAAIDTLIQYAGQALSVCELRDRSGHPTPLFNQALDELESEGHITWTDNDLVIHWPDPAPSEP